MTSLVKLIINTKKSLHKILTSLWPVSIIVDYHAPTKFHPAIIVDHHAPTNSHPAIIADHHASTKFHPAIIVDHHASTNFHHGIIVNYQAPTNSHHAISVFFSNKLFWPVKCVPTSPPLFLYSKKPIWFGKNERARG